MTRSTFPVALTIAGSDSGGGAGIQADLKTFAALKVHGTSVVTAVTAQNTTGVQGIYPLPPTVVQEQFTAVASDLTPQATKTGMLANGEIIRAVAEGVKRYGLKHLVVDPILRAKGGRELLEPGAIPLLEETLLPLAEAVTPNLEEAAILADMEGVPLHSLEGMQEAARRIRQTGVRYVLVKGGHLAGPAIDLLYDGEEFTPFTAERLPTPHGHGTGCTLSAAITAELAKGKPMKVAVATAKALVHKALRHALELGSGCGPVHPLASLYEEVERYRLLEELQRAMELLQQVPIGPILPEVQSNLGAALPWAEGVEEVAAFPGRMVRVGSEIKTIAPPRFGASSHVAHIILTVMRHDPHRCSAMNIRYTPEILDACRRLGLSLATFSRQEEPEQIRAVEGGTLEWGVEQAIRQFRPLGSVPDIIYDLGGMGKEGMIRVVGRDPQEVCQRVIEIWRTTSYQTRP